MATVTRNMPSHAGTGVVQFTADKPQYPVIDTVVTDEAVGSLKVHHLSIVCH